MFFAYPKILLLPLFILCLMFVLFSLHSAFLIRSVKTVHSRRGGSVVSLSCHIRHCGPSPHHPWTQLWLSTSSTPPHMSQLLVLFFRIHFRHTTLPCHLFWLDWILNWLSVYKPNENALDHVFVCFSDPTHCLCFRLFQLPRVYIYTYLSYYFYILTQLFISLNTDLFLFLSVPVSLMLSSSSNLACWLTVRSFSFSLRVVLVVSACLCICIPGRLRTK